MEDDNFTELAKADFTIKMWCGLIFGSIGLIGGIIGLIVSLVNKESTLAVMFIALIVVGLLVAGIDGFILFSKKKDKAEKTDK